MSNSLLPIFLIFILIAIISGGIFYFTSIKDIFEIRKFLSIKNLKKSIGLSIENGKGVHVSLGKSNLTNIHGAASFIGLETLNQIIDQSVLSDNPPVTTAGSGDVTLLAQTKHENTLLEKSASSTDIGSFAYLSGATNMSYIAGTIPVAGDKDLSTQVLVGNLGPEIGLIIDTCEKKNHFTLPATDNLEGQSVSYAFSENALIGEEIFSIPSQLSNKTIFKTSLLVQDLLRWLLIVVIIVAILLKLSGVL